MIWSLKLSGRNYGFPIKLPFLKERIETNWKYHLITRLKRSKITKQDFKKALYKINLHNTKKQHTDVHYAWPLPYSDLLKTLVYWGWNFDRHIFLVREGWMKDSFTLYLKQKAAPLKRLLISSICDSWITNHILQASKYECWFSKS